MCRELLDQARERGFHPRTLGGDKGYDTRDFVADLRRRRVTPHVALNNKGRSSAIDGRTTRQPEYAVSQRTRTPELSTTKPNIAKEPCELRSGGAEQLGYQLVPLASDQGLALCPSPTAAVAGAD